MLESIGLAGSEKADQRLNVLRALDKFDKFGIEGVKLLLGAGRKDESGDFTKGVGLTEGQISRLLDFISLLQMAEGMLKEHPLSVNPIAGVTIDGEKAVRGAIFDTLFQNFKDSQTGVEGVFELKQIWQLVEAAGYGPDRIKIDPSIVRGLEYYTGPVFEAELQFAVTNEKGEKVVFGSVGGGGRYDGLVSRFMGQPVPATGFSIGVSRLMTALKNLGNLGMEEVIAPVVVCVMDRDTESLGKYQQFTQQLRHAGIRAEMYQGNKKNFGDQLKYADRRGSPLAIIQGGDERSQGMVQIKDLIEGKRLSGEIEDNTTWREARVAQVSVPEGDLVAKVREMLAAQAEDRARNGKDA